MHERTANVFSKNWWIVTLCAVVVLVTLAGCSDNTGDSQGESTSTTKSADLPTEESTDLLTDASPTDTAEPTQSSQTFLEEVTIQLSDSFFEGLEPDEVIQNAKEEGITASLNTDGSYTYKIPKSKHTEIMKDMAKSIDDSISDLLTEKTYASVSNITYNKDFTEFSISADQEDFENSFVDSFVVFTIGLQGIAYQTFNGTPDNKVTINVIDSETKTTFNTVIYPDALSD